MSTNRDAARIGIGDLCARRGRPIGIFERALHSVFQRQIDRVFVLAARAFDGEERAQRILHETVLERLGESGGGDRAANENDFDGANWGGSAFAA